MIKHALAIFLVVIGGVIGKYFTLEDIKNNCATNSYFHIYGETYYGCYILLKKE